MIKELTCDRVKAPVVAPDRGPFQVADQLAKRLRVLSASRGGMEIGTSSTPKKRYFIFLSKYENSAHLKRCRSC